MRADRVIEARESVWRDELEAGESRELNALRRIHAAALLTSDLGRLGPLITAELAQLSGAPVVVLEEVNEAGTGLECRGVSGMEAGAWQRGCELLGEDAPSRRVLDRVTSVRARVNGWTFGDPGTHNYHGVPLVAAGRVYGVLSLLAPGEEAPRPSADEFLHGMAELLRSLRERRMAEETVIQREQELRAIYESVPLMVCLLDGEMRVVRTNAAMAGLSGRSAAEAVGLAVGPVLGCSTVGAKPTACGEGFGCQACQLVSMLKRTWSTGQPVENQEISWVAGLPSSPRVLSWLASSTRVRVGGEERLLLCLHDVTLVRQGEKEVQKNATRQVVSAVAEQRRLEGELLRAHRLGSVGALVSGVAHDLANLLTPVVLGADLLATGSVGSEDQETLRMMKESSRRAMDLLRQLLVFARGGNGDWRVVDVRSLLGEVQRVVKEVCPPGIVVEALAGEGDCSVAGDPTGIHQVLMNLCVNAKDAMRDGGRLRLRAASEGLPRTGETLPPQVRPGPFVRVSVEDTGTGIPPEVLGRIFEPFFSTKGTGEGTGLGLATSRRIVEAHGGFMEVETEAGRGTTFHVWLPALGDASVTEILRAESMNLQGKGERLLVVEDQAELRRAVRQLVAGNGYRCGAADSMASALAALGQRAEPVAVLVLDLEMPGMDPVLFLEQVRALGLATPPKVVGIVGAQLEAEADGRRKSLPVDRALSKPFSGRELLEAVRAVLSRG